MKTGFILVSAIVPALIVISVWQIQMSTASAKDQENISVQMILEVDQFMRSVERYPGTVRIKGVVSVVDTNQKTFALIDSGEFQKCRITSCAQLVLPVRWDKDMPDISQTVVVTGAVRDSAGKRIFNAIDMARVTAQPKPGEVIP